MRLFEEEIPSFNLKFSFQSNMAFMLAVFILTCALAWAIRDHRRRQMELVTEEKEDKLYLNILLVLFSVCILGSYYSFNRTKIDPASGQAIMGNILLDEFFASVSHLKRKLDKSSRTWPPYAPDKPISMPIPDKAVLESKIKENTAEPDMEYSGLSLALAFLVALLCLWYFFPKPRKQITPPQPYMDAPGMWAGPVEDAAPSRGSKGKSKKSNRSRKTPSKPKKRNVVWKGSGQHLEHRK